MKYIESVLRSLATVALVILVIQWGWNQFFPLFGWPKLNIIQTTGLFVMTFLSICCASIAWNSQKQVPYFYYKLPDDKNDVE